MSVWTQAWAKNGFKWLITLSCLSHLAAAAACRQFELPGAMPGLHQLATPNFPQPYPPNLDCVRIIQAPPGYDILIHFSTVFEVEASYKEMIYKPLGVSTNCPNDYLEIRDGRHSFSERLARYCGMRAPPASLRARSGFAHLHFHSDGLLEYRGFSVAYEFVARDSDARSPPARANRSACYFQYADQLDGQLNTSSVQEFLRRSSTSSTVAAALPMECVWELRVPRWLSLAVFVNELRLQPASQCHESAFEIYAGRVAPTALKQYCSSASAYVYTGQSIVYLRFYATTVAQLNGFHADILFTAYVLRKNCSSERHDLFACGDDVCVPRALICNGRANCQYRMDETNCYRRSNVLQQALTSSYSLPLCLLAAVFSSIAGLCLWYWPCGSEMTGGAAVDSYFRQFLPYTTAEDSVSHTSRAYPRQAPHKSRHQCANTIGNGTIARRDGEAPAKNGALLVRAKPVAIERHYFSRHVTFGA